MDAHELRSLHIYMQDLVCVTIGQEDMVSNPSTLDERTKINRQNIQLNTDFGDMIVLPMQAGLPGDRLPPLHVTVAMLAR